MNALILASDIDINTNKGYECADTLILAAYMKYADFSSGVDIQIKF